MLLLLSSTAFAGKAHREGKKKVAPKITEGEAAIKKACGSSPAFSIDKAYDKATTDHADDVARNMIREIEAVTKVSTKFCNDAESKALYKTNAKKVILSFKEGSDTETTYSKGTFVIKTTFQGNSAGFKFEEFIDEW